MTVQEILNQSKTKTWKIQQLVLLGKSRIEIANLQVLGKYGAIQNVYAAMLASGQMGTQPAQSAPTVNAAPSQVQVQTQPTVSRRPSQRSGRSQNPPTPSVPRNPNLVSMVGNRSLEPFERKFGVEMEAFGVSRQTLKTQLLNQNIACETEEYNHSARRHWKFVNDSSISGSNSFECVSPILIGNAGLEELRKVCTVLQMNNVQVNKSCGVHIHFDATGIGFIQMQNLLLNYISFEEEIDSFMSITRRASVNQYTRSVKTRSDAVKAATTLSGLISAFPDRYYKVNMKAYERQNTIEFRQHSGTVEYEKISNWVLFLHNLVDYSLRHKYPQSEADFNALKRLNQKIVFDYLITRKNQLAA